MKEVQKFINVEFFIQIYRYLNGPKIDPDGEIYEAEPYAKIFHNNEEVYHISRQEIYHLDTGSYKFIIKFKEDDPLDDDWKVVWYYTIDAHPPNEDVRTEFFKLVDKGYSSFSSVEDNKREKVLKNVRELVCDVGNPLRSFTLTRNPSISSAVQVKDDKIILLNENTVEYIFPLKQYSTINSLVIALDDLDGWVCTKEVECPPTRSSLDLMETPKLAAGSGALLYFEYFFNDSRLYDLMELSLAHFNNDWRSSYTLETLPEDKLYAFLLLAAHRILLIRTSEDVKSLAEYLGEGRISSISLGGKLSVGFDHNDSDNTKGAIDSWFKLSQYYLKLYNEITAKHAPKAPFPEVSTHEYTSFVRRTGRKQYRTDEGINYNGELQGKYLDGNVYLHWNPVFDRDFAQYILFRTNAEEEMRKLLYDEDVLSDSPFIITRINDNHKFRYQDIPDTSGSYYYMLGVVNRNGIIAYSNMIGIVF